MLIRVIILSIEKIKDMEEIIMENKEIMDVVKKVAKSVIAVIDIFS